jgi:hypothetical protein
MPPGIADITEGREPPLGRSNSKPSRKETIMSLVELLLKDDENPKGALTVHCLDGSLVYTQAS